MRETSRSSGSFGGPLARTTADSWSFPTNEPVAGRSYAIFRLRLWPYLSQGPARRGCPRPRTRRIGRSRSGSRADALVCWSAVASRRHGRRIGGACAKRCGAEADDGRRHRGSRVWREHGALSHLLRERRSWRKARPSRHERAPWSAESGPGSTSTQRTPRSPLIASRRAKPIASLGDVASESRPRPGTTTRRHRQPNRHRRRTPKRIRRPCRDSLGLVPCRWACRCRHRRYLASPMRARTQAP
jgi:hypothetical protein